ncbi:MAG TPA: hypothetical protein P5137_15170 [Candidatus Brocadiia bacterium]|nr:hypothetical protein [Candidatus Brocadiia bacterium]
MSILGDVSFSVANVIGRPAADAPSEAPGAAMSGPTVLTGTGVEVIHAGQNVTTGKGLPRLSPGQKGRKTEDSEESLEPGALNEMMPLILRVLRSFLPTEEKVRLIHDVIIQYGQLDIAERPFFLRRMILLVSELEDGLPPHQRNTADDRAQVMAALRNLLVGPIVIGETAKTPDEPAARGVPTNYTPSRLDATA